MNWTNTYTHVKQLHLINKGQIKNLKKYIVSKKQINKITMMAGIN